MILFIINVIIVAIHILATHFNVPLALTHHNINEFWGTYLYGNFVHSSTYHLITNLIAFDLIYILFPISKPWFNLSFGWKILLVFLILNVIINIFEMSSYNAHHPKIYYGISGTTYAIYFICSAFWYHHQKAIGILMAIGGLCFILATPYVNQYLDLNLSNSRVAREAHTFGFLISIYGYHFLTKVLRQSYS